MLPITPPTSEYKVIQTSLSQDNKSHKLLYVKSFSRLFIHRCDLIDLLIVFLKPQHLKSLWLRSRGTTLNISEGFLQPTGSRAVLDRNQKLLSKCLFTENPFETLGENKILLHLTLRIRPCTRGELERLRGSRRTTLNAFYLQTILPVDKLVLPPLNSKFC